MANTNRYRYGKKDFVEVPVASAVAVEIGDMIKLASNLGVVVTAATDNQALYAIAMQAHAAGSGDKKIRCALIKPGVVWEFALNAETSVSFGDKLQISGAQELKKSATDPVAHAVETNATATKIRCTFSLPKLSQGDTS